MPAEPGILVRTVREKRGWTQQELATRAGTTQSAIARLESGGRSPSVATLERIIGALDHKLTVVAEPLDFGVDRSLLRSRLGRTPLQRLRDLKAFARFAIRARRAGKT